MIGLRYILAASLATALTGCGVGYIPAKVDVSAENVTVVPLTNDSVQAANQNAYVPKKIPDAFFQNAGSPSAMRGAGAAPPPSPGQLPSTIGLYVCICIYVCIYIYIYMYIYVYIEI